MQNEFKEFIWECVMEYIIVLEGCSELQQTKMGGCYGRLN